MERAEELANALIGTLAEGIALRWRELGALEVVLEEIAVEVDGEDVLHPHARALFDATMEQLRSLQTELADRRIACVLDAPTLDEIEALRAVVRKRR